jgi:DNA topoisomerase-2
MEKENNIKFQKLSQREHVLQRSGMYVGSINTELTDMYCVDNTQTFSVIKKQVRYNAAFLKIFDEVISNASDAAIKYQNVSYIKVNIDRESNTITVENDCTPQKCIPVTIQEDEKCYVPEMIFSHLLTGSNYDDTETRFSAGVNGMGVKLTNIFSTKCSVQVADGKKLFKQDYSDNMSIISKPKVTDSTKCYVKFSYTPDFSRFNGLDQISDDDISLILKRMLDISVCIPNVKMYFNNEKIGVKNFKEWMSKHLNDDSNLYIDDSNPNWIYGVAKSPSDEFNAVSVTSTVSTYRGGTHINYLSLNVSKAIADSFSKKIKANWADVKNKLMLFVVCRIPNPMFDSQTKEYLTNTINKECLGDFKISESFIKKVMKSDIVESILAAIERKENDELKKLQKQQQKVKVEKLVDANSKNRSMCQIFVFEGDSASSNARLYRDPQTQGFYLLKGKFANVSKMTQKEILNTKEVVGLMNSIGLELNTKVDFKSLRYNEILICCDADFDGDAITGLLINFFASQWKELFEKGMIYRVMTPLIIASKGKDNKYFYTDAEWVKYQENNSIKGWEVTFCKGLGSLNGEAYKDMMENPRKIQLNWDNTAKELLHAWFGDDVALRKNMLK